MQVPPLWMAACRYNAKKGDFMKKSLWIKMTAAALIVCMCSGTVAKATTQDAIDDTKNQIDALQNQKEDAEQQVDDISDYKADLEGNLGELNGQLSDIVASINSLESQLTEKQAEIDDAQTELNEATARSNQQYEDMKTRIRFMYENSSTSVWELLFESESLTDFLNRTEYVADINSYDRDKLEEYQKLQEEIADKKTALEAEQANLVAMQEEMQQKKSSVNSLITTTEQNISNADSQLADAQANVDEISGKLEQMIAYEKELEIKKAKEDAARLAAIKAQEQENTSNVSYVPQDSDAYLLGAIIQCEADGESYDGKLAVGSVVLNRVKSSYFPNTVAGVIYQSGQFSPVTSGRLAYRLEAGVNSTCLQAAQDVLDGNITVSCLYFCANNGIISGTVIGNHVFY